MTGNCGSDGIPYVRPSHSSRLTAAEKTQLLNEHFAHYAALISQNPAALNVKVPRTAFDQLLNQIGSLLLAESKRLATADGPVRDFLEGHPLPPTMSQRLPD